MKEYYVKLTDMQGKTYGSVAYQANSPSEALVSAMEYVKDHYGSHITIAKAVVILNG